MAEKRDETALAYPRAWKYRVLVAVAVASPLVVGGGAVVLIAHALAHSWLWGLAGLAVVLTLFALVSIALVLYGRRNPEAAQAYIAAYGRAKGGFPIRAFPWVEGGRAGLDETERVGKTRPDRG
jgi:hypothetical protein